MKIKVQNEKKEFQPIELKLIIESEEDLCDLWHRFNIHLKKIIEHPEYHTPYSLIHNKDSLNYEIWCVIDRLCVELNLYTPEDN